MKNAVIDAILSRRSIRAYEKTPVPAEALETLVQCGLYAATAMGLQPWHFTVVTDRKVLDAISEGNRQLMLASPDARARENAAQPGFDNFRGAPAAIIVSGDGSGFAATDCANAVQNMAVAAQSLGLSTCYIASFRQVFDRTPAEELLQKLAIPAGYRPLYALAVGYGAETPGERAPRRDGSVNWV